MADYVGAIDQGTNSTRFMVFDHGGNSVARHQVEHELSMPRQGWGEHDPAEIWAHTCEVVETGMRSAGIAPGDLVALGITNQRETTWCGTRTPASRTATRSSGKTPAPTRSPPHLRHLEGVRLALIAKLDAAAHDVAGATSAASGGREESPRYVRPPERLWQSPARGSDPNRR